MVVQVRCDLTRLACRHCPDPSDEMKDMDEGIDVLDLLTICDRDAICRVHRDCRHGYSSEQ